MLKKYFVILGVAVTMMLACVGCGTEEKETKVTTTTYETEMEELNDLAEDTMEYSTALYQEAFVEIFGEDFDESKLGYDMEENWIYGDQVVSHEYVEEVAYNLMVNEY